jgi:hypothetical protein
MDQLTFGPFSALGGLLCPLIAIFFIVLIIFSIVRAVGRRGSGTVGGVRGSTVNVPTQLGEDGFWVGPCSCDPSAVIYYHYWSGGARHSGQIAYQPGPDGRQFVYTGRKPDQVSIARIVEQTDDTTSDIIPPIVAGTTGMWGLSPSDEPEPPSAPASSAPFPSAY